MARMTGVSYITVNGRRLRSKPGASLKPGGRIREGIADSNGFCGNATKEIKGAEVKLTLPHAADDDVVVLQNLEDATVLFETDSGQRYLVREAGTVGEVELKGNEVELTLSGHEAERV